MTVIRDRDDQTDDKRCDPATEPVRTPKLPALKSINDLRRIIGKLEGWRLRHGRRLTLAHQVDINGSICNLLAMAQKCEEAAKPRRRSPRQCKGAA